MKNILVPCDFSAPAEEAFKFAVNIASSVNGEISVLNILDTSFIDGAPSLDQSYTFNIDFLREKKEKAEERFTQMWKRYAPLTLKVRFIHQIGALVQDVNDFVNRWNIDCIMMGTHGEKELHWGSNADRIVRSAAVPVIVIRATPALPIKKVILPIGLELYSAAFMQKAADFAAFFNASIDLLFINTPDYFRADSDSEDRLKRFIEDNRLKNVSWHILSDFNPTDGVVRYTKDLKDAVIVAGTHARKGILRTLSGSIVEDLVNKVNLPIWTCRM